MPCCNAFRISQLPGQCHALWMGLKTEIGWTPRRQDGMMMDESMSTGASLLPLLWVLQPGDLVFGLNRLFRIETVLPQPPSRIPRAWSSQVDRTTSWDDSHSGQLGSHSPSFGLPCSVVPRSRSPFPGGASTLGLGFDPVRARSYSRSRGSASGFRSPFYSWHLQWWLVGSALAFLQRVDFAPCLALASRVPTPRLGSSGFLSLASGFDAGGSLGQGWCSARDWQCSPSFVRVNARGFDFPRVYIRDRLLSDSSSTTLSLLLPRP